MNSTGDKLLNEETALAGGSLKTGDRESFNSLSFRLQASLANRANRERSIGELMPSVLAITLAQGTACPMTRPANAPRTNNELSKPSKETTALILRYRLADVVQRPIGFAFWLIEQRKAKLADKLAAVGVRV